MSTSFTNTRFQTTLVPPTAGAAVKPRWLDEFSTAARLWISLVVGAISLSSALETASVVEQRRLLKGWQSQMKRTTPEI